MYDKKLVELQTDEKKEFAIKASKLLTDNVSSSALTISCLLGHLADVGKLISQIDELIIEVSSGDNRRIKDMLISQSATLQAIFNHMASKSADATTTEGFKIYMDIALKAQNQCRNTLLALKEIQNPSQQQTIVKQQNVAINQQVNNQNEVVDKSVQIDFANELIKIERMGEAKNEALDIRRTLKASAINQKAETLAAIDRGKDCDRENN